MTTLDDIKQELREFTREHFKQALEQQTDPEREVLKQTWKAIKDDPFLDDAQRTCLAAYNIPEKKQDAFLEKLSEKYQAQKMDLTFTQYIKRSFQITAVFGSHLERFATEIGLDELLSAPHTPEQNILTQQTLKTQLHAARDDSSVQENKHAYK